MVFTEFSGKTGKTPTVLGHNWPFWPKLAKLAENPENSTKWDFLAFSLCQRPQSDGQKSRFFMDFLTLLTPSDGPFGTLWHNNAF